MEEYLKRYNELKLKFATYSSPYNIGALYDFKKELESTVGEPAAEILADISDLLLPFSKGIETVKQIVNSGQYQDLVDIIRKKAKIELSSDEDTVTEACYDARNMKLANLSGAEVMKLLETDKAFLIRFALLKIEKYENEPIEDEYPIGEEPDPEDVEDDNIIILGYSRRFLLMYIVEYYLLKTNPSKLGAYLKDIGFPHAKKYEEGLKELYHACTL